MVRDFVERMLFFRDGDKTFFGLKSFLGLEVLKRNGKLFAGS
jgi:hypothetical protein